MRGTSVSCTDLNESSCIGPELEQVDRVPSSTAYPRAGGLSVRLSHHEHKLPKTRTGALTTAIFARLHFPLRACCNKRVK